MEGLCTGAEMVLVPADPPQLTDGVRRGERGAATALALLEHPDRALATTLTGTNIFVVLSTVLTTSHFLPRYGGRAAWIAVGVIPPLVILFGEVVPKSFAQPRADRLVGPAARFIWFAQWGLYPLVSVAGFFARGLSPPLGPVPPPPPPRARLFPLSGVPGAAQPRRRVSSPDRHRGTAAGLSRSAAHAKSPLRARDDAGRRTAGDIFRGGGGR